MDESDPRSQTDVVVQGVRRMVVTGELVPGARLPVERDLAQRFGVSRGSLREGVRALSHLGVVEVRQGSGTYVTALDPAVLLAPVGFVADLQAASNVRDLQAVRRILETASVRLAALHLDEPHALRAEEAVQAGAAALRGRSDHQAAMEADLAFHRALAEASGNAVLSSLIAALSGSTARARLWRALADERAADRTVLEHREILDAVRAGDPEAAAVRMAGHLLSVETFLARQVSAPHS